MKESLVKSVILLRKQCFVLVFFKTLRSSTEEDMETLLLETITLLRPKLACFLRSLGSVRLSEGESDPVKEGGLFFINIITEYYP